MAVRKTKVARHKPKHRHRVVRRARLVHRRRHGLRRRHGSWEQLLPKAFVKEAKRALQTPAIIGGATLVVLATVIALSRTPAVAPAPELTPAAQAALSELDRGLSALQGKTLRERVAHWAMTLSPEWVSRLRDLPGAPGIEDIAPLVPPNFDCTTFVETVAALARSTGASDFYDRLIGMRYNDSKATFFDRNHFPEADWIPNNTRSGILEDVTLKIARTAGVDPKSESKRINRASWFAYQLKKGEYPGLAGTEPVAEWRTPVSVNVPYLSIDDAERFVDHLPSGSIVNVVRAANPKQWVLITHQAFVVRLGGVTYLRHSTRDGRIHTVRLTNYLKNNAGTQWPVVGLNVLSLN